MNKRERAITAIVGATAMLLGLACLAHYGWQLIAGMVLIRVSYHLEKQLGKKP